ncbi:MAG: YggT family protein [Solirubrobacterales bacterium]|nr:YggT family protein [Solirubrobacterales bacterium]
MILPAAIDRNDVAQFVDSLFLVFIILVIASVAISWYTNFRGALPYNRPLRAVTGFIDETTTPYLNAFRRFLPPVGGGGLSLDLSPMIGLIVLFVLRAVVVGLING